MSTMVKLSVRTLIKTPALRKLNKPTLDNVETDIDQTWEEFFENNFKLKLDVSKYMVQRSGLKKFQTSGLRQPIRDLLRGFQRVLPVYRVDVVKCNGFGKRTTRGTTSGLNPPQKRGRGRPPKPKQTEPIIIIDLEETPDQTKPPRQEPVTGSLDPPVRAETPSEAPPQKPQASSVPRSVPSTSTGQIRSPPRPPRPIQVPLMQPTSSQTLKLSSLRNLIGSEDGLILNDEDDDDAASQFTTATEDSQELLSEQGIKKDDAFRPRVAGKLIQNISNSQLLIIRNELRELSANRKQWMKYSSRAPQTSIFLNELFL